FRLGIFMLNFTNLALRRGPRLLFEQATFSIHSGYKVGITGANGCGKSTLFALLLGEIHSDQGSAEIPAGLAVAHVKQEVEGTDRPAIEYVLDGDAELRSVEEKLAAAEAADDGMLQAELHLQMGNIDAYTARARAARILQGLGFKTEQLDLPVNEFSGGWRMRLNLAQALICRSDMMLLDEPTNHLDLDAVIWLEAWLKDYKGTLLLISHDRDFLDAVVTHMLFIEQQRLKLYTGNYSDFETRRAEQLAQQQSMFVRQQREIEHVKHFIERFKAKASKARQAQSRIKTLERMELISAAHVDSPFSFSFFEPLKMPNPLMHLADVSIGYPGKPILSGVNMSLLPGDRIGLLGHNGAGKSTLIKLMAGEIKQTAGELTVSPELRIGYFAQQTLELLDPKASAMLHLQRINKRATEQELRTFLGSFGFVGDNALVPVAPFSGGEKARLVLAILTYQKPNLLLLDEPTNHLDLDMRHALSMALQEYVGAMVIVSHDRHLLSAVCERFLLVDEGQAQVFDGDIAAYRQWLLQPREQIREGGDNKAGRKAQRANNAGNKSGNKTNPQNLQKRQQQLEQQLDRLNQQLQVIDEALAQPDIYTPENRSRMQSLTREQGELKKRLAQVEAEWLDVGEQLGA
ncbi:MAG TPA: ATP-binding cassette domain-containing protein, partial [Gammaproteobacteria bacterium]|nr:ATP-binding cassette domain-containing protein [Gammaproteobacteria bacterium]